MQPIFKITALQADFQLAGKIAIKKIALVVSF